MAVTSGFGLVLVAQVRRVASLGVKVHLKVTVYGFVYAKTGLLPLHYSLDWQTLMMTAIGPQQEQSETNRGGSSVRLSSGIAGMKK